MALQSPLGKAIGLGSAKHGYSHWWLQRVSAVALIPLCIWFIYSVVCLIQSDYSAVTAWFASPVQTSLMIIFILTLIYHAQTGLQVVIEDYIHAKCANLVLIYGVKFASVLMAVVAVVSIFRIGA
jgi:succinate dehydrogenase / fumarate reductase membrane anchor subunit